MDFIELKDKKYLETLLREEYSSYLSTTHEKTIYNHGFAVKGKAFNYLNSKSSKESQSIFRPLISKIFLDLESIYPNLGEEFIKLVMEEISKPGFKEKKLVDIEKNIESMLNKVKKNSHHLDKKYFNYFVKNEISQENKKIIKKIVENMSISTRVFIEETHLDKNVILKSDSITFNIDFDDDFLIGKRSWESKDYNFVIIDGFIDTVGEIYHLLQKANEDKEPYVVFCKGMKPEVKDVLLQNLKRGTINIFPISLDVNELNVNILVDIAMLHGSDVISPLKGETISIAVRRKLEKGSKIRIDRNTFSFDPLISNRVISNHLKYLENRKLESEVSANTDILEKRIKILSADKMILKISSEDNWLFNDIKKTLYFLKSGSTGVFCGKKNNITSINILPTYSMIFLIKKVLSFLKTIYTTECAVIISNKNN